MADSSLDHSRFRKTTSDTEYPLKKLLALRCSVCLKLPFVPPIVYLTNRTMRCGRCSYLPLELAERASLLESLAAGMAFPCPYIGCYERVPWGEVLQHEQVCPKRDFGCPFWCPAKNKAEGMTLHLMGEHPEKMGSDFLLPEGGSLLLFLIYEGEPYAVRCYSDQRKTGIDILGFSAAEVVQTFDLFIRSATAFTTIKNQQVASIRCLETCWKCALGSCANRYHVGQPGLGASGTNIAGSFLRRKLGAGPLRCEIVMHVRRRDAVSVGRLLTCPICHSFMTPPIFQCITGHSVCGACRGRLADSTCPFCRAEYRNTRNYSLEALNSELQ